MLLRRFFHLACLLVSAAMFTHCGATGKKKQAGSPADSPETITISVNYSTNNPQQVAEWQGVIGSYFDTVLAPKLNGQMLVAKNGEIIFERYQGVTAFGKDSTGVVDAHTPLHLASVTKTFTAMAVLKLQEAGKLTIDDSVTRYLPNFPYPGMTLRMLLNHRSGLINYVHNLAVWGWPENKMATNQDVLQLLGQQRPPLNFTPGTKFSYCNTNYAMLALIIEKASGLSYPQYLKRTFFTPLQMTDTYVFEPKDTATATPSYDWKGRLIPFNFLDGVYGDKNVYSTVRDLYKWDQALYTRQLFTAATLDAAFAPYSFEKPGIKNYGLGWRMLLFDNGRKITFHNGWWHGNMNCFLRLTQDSATIIVLGNKHSRANYSAIQLSYLFGDYPFEMDPEEGADSTQTSGKDSLLIKLIKNKSDSLKLKKDKAVKPVLRSDTVAARKEDTTVN